MQILGSIFQCKSLVQSFNAKRISMNKFLRSSTFCVTTTRLKNKRRIHSPDIRGPAFCAWIPRIRRIRCRKMSSTQRVCPNDFMNGRRLTLSERFHTRDFEKWVCEDSMHFSNPMDKRMLYFLHVERVRPTQIIQTSSNFGWMFAYAAWKFSTVQSPRVTCGCANRNSWKNIFNFFGKNCGPLWNSIPCLGPTQSRKVHTPWLTFNVAMGGFPSRPTYPFCSNESRVTTSQVKNTMSSVYNWIQASYSNPAIDVSSWSSSREAAYSIHARKEVQTFSSKTANGLSNLTRENFSALGTWTGFSKPRLTSASRDLRPMSSGPMAMNELLFLSIFWLFSKLRVMLHDDPKSFWQSMSP